MDIAVPFLLDRFEIPADMFDLFLATGIVNSRRVFELDPLPCPCGGNVKR